MLQKPPFGGRVKRVRGYFVHDEDLFGVHFDLFDDGSDDLPALVPVGAVQTADHLAGEVLHPTDHQPELLLLGLFIHLCLGFGSQSLQAMLGLLDAWFELVLFQQAILKGVDQPSNATLRLADSGLKLFDTIPSYAFLPARQPAPILLLDALGIRQQRADIFPHRLLQQVGPNLPVVAHSLATEPVGVRTGAAVVGIVALLALAGRQADGLAVVRIPALLADQQALQQMPGAPSALPTAPAVLGQLFLDDAEEVLAHDRRDGNAGPLVWRNIVGRVRFARLFTSAALSA